jgi:hypothetical protein
MRAVAFVVMVALVLAAAGASLVLAQQGQMGGPMGGQGAAPGMGRGMQQQEVTPEQFPELKARVLKMLDDRKARLEQERACVEKATNDAEMKKCRPEPPMGGQQRGPVPPRPPQPGEQGAK